uniref:Succinate dehydrogenase [ubiquinone] flavoprotein subunit, mitochondrial-like n=1 Tax=Diabrotica virgifera virgifera TaxID=50390 RepID=A0A6P7H8A3_DIAVI
SKFPIINHHYDAVVVGAGGAGLRAASALVQHGFKTACITKMFPTRSHTIAAQGGVNAALSNLNQFMKNVWAAEDSKKCLECRRLRAKPGVFSSENRVSREDMIESRYGRIMDRLQTCAAADATGHYMLHALYGEAVRHHVKFFIEYYVLDLLVKDDKCLGVLAWNLEDGTLH